MNNFIRLCLNLAISCRCLVAFGICLATSAESWATTYYWNCDSVLPTDGSASNIISAAFNSVQGNNNGTTTLITSSSISGGYPNASAGNNFGAACKTGELTIASSTYFELTITPSNNCKISLRSISLGTRSTSTGPKAVSIYSSIDNYSASLGTASVQTDSNWGLIELGFSGNSTTGAVNAPVTLRIYGWGGTGSPNATANWRIDDIRLSVTSDFLGPKMLVTLPGETSPRSGGATAQVAGNAFEITLTATTDGTAVDTTYYGPKSISFSGPSGNPNYPSTVNFNNGIATASVTLSKAEVTSITATDGLIQGIASSDLLVNPGPIDHYSVNVSSSQIAGIPFNVVVTAKDQNENTVTTDSATSVTLGSSSGNMEFDANPKTLSTGALSVSATDDVPETTIITATDANSKTGSSTNIDISLANATAVLWSSSGGSAWLTAGNWTNNTIPTASQVAQFGVNPTGDGFVGINMSIASGNQNVGAIEVTSARSLGLFVGDSSSTPGTLTLTGVAINGVPNVILRNNSSASITLEAVKTGAMGLVLGNPNDNKVVIDASGNVFISSIISGEGSLLTLSGSGSGALQISGANSYGGGTRVSSGRLIIANTSGSATGSGAVSVNANGILAGNGSISGNVTLNGTISPGNSTGTLTAGAMTWNGAAIYLWEVDNLTNDLLNLASLNIAATTGNKFNVNITSLGVLAGWDSKTAKQWTIAHTAGGITGFDSAAFTLTDNFAAKGNSLGAAGYFTVEQSGNDLVLKYNPLTATADIVQRTAGKSVKISIASLMANDSVTGGTITGLNTNGADGQVILNGAWIFYTPSVNDLASDSFSYTLTDINGKTTTATVTVVSGAAAIQARQLTSVAAGAGSFYGIPGTSYTVQYSDDLATWRILTVVTTDSNGLGSFTDPDFSQEAPPRFYRIVYP